MTAPVAAATLASSIPVTQTTVAADSSGDSEPQVVSATLAGIRPTLVPTDTYASLQWHLDAINVEGVWDKYSCRGIKVGIIDDGFDHYHSDLDGRYNRATDYDVRNRDFDAFASTWGDNHRTAVMGVIAV